LDLKFILTPYPCFSPLGGERHYFSTVDLGYSSIEVELYFTKGGYLLPLSIHMSKQLNIFLMTIKICFLSEDWTNDTSFESGSFLGFFSSFHPPPMPAQKWG
jgi:hypothetical protein